jgi:type II secretory pathway pseudopilin PulG
MILLSKYRQQGFTLLAMLIMINLVGLSLSLCGKYWYTIKKREMEKELIFRGCQFIKAIDSYYENSPGSNMTYPSKLSDLLHDSRFSYKKRHIRRIYKNPLEPYNDWQTIVDKGKRIRGVYIKSEMEPLKKDGFPCELSHFIGKERYSDWKFIHYPTNKK